jgi:2-dehydropantoate 2-reductase
MSHLSIAIIGLGGIGSAFAYQLALAGHDLTVVARPGSLRLQQLLRDQGIILQSDLRANVRVTDHLDEQIAYDLVLVTTLAHQVDSIIPSLKKSKAKSIQFMFNNFNPEHLRDIIGPDRCSFGMPFLMASLDVDGKLNHKVNPGQNTLHGDQRWVNLFRSAGLPSTYEADILLWLRCHTPLCIAFESICVTGESRQGGATWSESMSVARGVKGGFTVIKALGYKIYPNAKSRLSSCPTWLISGMLWFVSRIPSFRKLLATGRNECQALIKVMAAAGSEIKSDLPGAVDSILAMKPIDLKN